ncbi:MAG TPA: helix-turn-helix transcriptional regulator [Flavobacterium sp.]|jgi:transcriptional regulator with XRE-family HTH domain
MSFGKRITEIRKEKNMSQEQLAKALQATPTTIGRYERDEVKPSVDVAVKIAEALDVSLDYITGRSKNDIKDKKMIERFNSILSLPEEDKKCILYAIDGLLRDAKTRQAYAS